jgi:hypothetical protein
MNALRAQVVQVETCNRVVGDAAGVPTARRVVGVNRRFILQVRNHKRLACRFVGPTTLSTRKRAACGYEE